MSDDEVWKVFPSDPRYDVSTLGRVRNRATGRVRKPVAAMNGYMTLVFSTPDGHVARYVHRMVLETWVGACPEDQEVSHLDGDRTHNHLTNLKYETTKENHHRKIEHGTDYNSDRNPAAKLAWPQILEIRASTESEEALAARFGVTRATIGRARRGESWKF